ncbi:MAG: Do family serine endopeptidase, partial [Granulosicoccaceae bacterium]
TRKDNAMSLPPGLDLPDLENTPFGEMLKKFLEEQQRGGGGQGRPGEEPSSLGSGFIISEDGYVLTNNHVVEGADQVIVRLSDRRQLEAEVIGTDKRSDVAVLKLEASGLPVAKIGSSESLKVGEWVLAIGSPFGFDFSVTAGIVSAKGRSLPNENYTPFIQTDVAINPGNSGGPLFNLDGEVVGINSQIYSRSGGFMGLSFAIPIETAMDVADQLRETGSVSRGWLGVVIQEVTRDLAESFGMSTASGALVSQILEGSPASKSDLQVGDVIVGFNGSPVNTSSALPPLVGRVRAGSDAKVDVMREGERMTLTVNIGELPQADELASRSGGKPIKKADNKLGLTVIEPDEEEREAAEVETGGVLVTEVEQNSPAMRAGIVPGDFIMRLHGEKLDSIEDYQSITANIDKGSSVAVLIQRQGRPMFLALRLPE